MHVCLRGPQDEYRAELERQIMERKQREADEKARDRSQELWLSPQRNTQRGSPVRAVAAPPQPPPPQRHFFPDSTGANPPGTFDDGGKARASVHTKAGYSRPLPHTHEGSSP
jgi:hypothetical protein